LIATSIGVALARGRRSDGGTPVIASETAIQWRVLWVTLSVFAAASILGHFDVSFRHFTIPLVLIILLLAPLPHLLERMRQSAPLAARVLIVVTVLLAASSLVTAVRTYPHYFPYFNVLSMGRPTYWLASDSNVDWDQALPEVKQFADQHHIAKLEIDIYGFSDPVPIVPQAEVWNCQRPTTEDQGQWVVVSANMILDTHNCGWLLQYPSETLAAGGMYAFHLPSPIPVAGTSGGPPLPADQREFVGAPVDIRALFIDMSRHPEKLADTLDKMAVQFAEAMAKAKAQKKK
jgi:hypothetical protein